MELKVDEVASLLKLLRSLHDQKPYYPFETWDEVVVEYLLWDNRLVKELQKELGIPSRKKGTD